MARDGEKLSTRLRTGDLFNEPGSRSGGQPIIVLSEPQLGENIGATARAMLNFGLTGLRLINPRDGWPNAQAGAMASGAGQVLDEAQLFATVKEAVADCQFVLATTARHRDMALPVITPQAAVQSLETRIAAGARTAILFGGERSGLSSEDVAKAQAIIKVPVNPDFSSLNLAQAVLVIAYEWSKATRVKAIPSKADQSVTSRSPIGPSSIGIRSRNAGREGPDRQIIAAPSGDQTALLGHLFEALEAGGFFHPPEKTRLMQRNIEVMIRRAQLTEQEVRSFRGMIKALTGGRGR